MTTTRDDQIRAAYAAPGATLASVGRQFTLTRQRVSQIVGPEATAAKMAEAASARAAAAADRERVAADQAAAREAQREADEHPQEAFGIRVGDKIGRWTVLSIGLEDASQHNARGERVRAADVRCSCPAQTRRTVNLNNLRRGVSRSCGCLNREGRTSHGMSRHPLYRPWTNMMARCYDAGTRGYETTGRRGIGVFPVWREDPATFITWIGQHLGPRPDGAWLVRIDTARDYEPGNLAWSLRGKADW